MAKGIREIKSRIKSVQSTKQITKAMEMVAASKLKRAQDSAQSSRPYAEKIKEVIENVAASTTDSSHPMLVSRPIKRTGYILITSDRGQAGGYNANVFRLLMDTIKEKHASPDEYAIFVLGKKGRDNLKKREIPVLEEIVDLNDTPTFSEIRLLTNKAVQYYAEGQYDELYLVYNQFISALQQVPVVNRLLPLAEMSGDKAANNSQYEYEPSAEAVLEVLLPKYAETLIYNALLEAKASEFGARMTAMGNATKNATEMISGLTLVYNRARQAAITQEITEIVAGASAQS